ncbi:HAD-superfamily subfamily IB hydrolase, TIGR01490 [Polaromonas sp. CF318]|uniref:HAD-IB family hydrolase n=1 Tax=Polaromonas sp. CF318 TaxID=1144318 RepID=UPI00027126CF|nr:HAD-IB family hydrolase [Polaromonas sp. CF318]EJL81737.1 HAD-superfamily subfamily IB hydrolase, TIGR01490 [Polaromonas sp. CF318]
MPELSAQDAGPVVAAFDFDGTLTRRDTFTVFLARGLGWPRFVWALLRCSPWLVAYALRIVPNNIAKGKLMQATLAGRSLAEIDGWAAQWLAKDFPGQLREDAMAHLARHREAGHCCVMVSASPDIYLKQVARQLGFDALLCTEMEVTGEAEARRLTGRMRTPNCHGEQKVVRLRDWAAGRFGAAGLEGVTLYAYGDTSGDKPMLRLARYAWYRGEPWTG